MKTAIILLPGLNRDRDMIAAITKVSGQEPITVWQTDTDIPDVDLIVVPGGFSYGDYLRCGAIAARMPFMKALQEKYFRVWEGKDPWTYKTDENQRRIRLRAFGP